MNIALIMIIPIYTLKDRIPESSSVVFQHLGQHVIFRLILKCYQLDGCELSHLDFELIDPNP